MVLARVGSSILSRKSIAAVVFALWCAGCTEPDGLYHASRPTPVPDSADWILSIRAGGLGRIGRLGPTGDVRMLTAHGDAFDPWVTRDGRRVLFSREADDHKSEIWEMAIDGSQAHRVAAAGGRDARPVATGDVLVFARGGRFRETSTFGTTWDDWDLVQMTRGGGRQTRLTNRKFRQIMALDVLPDGRILMTAEDQGAEFKLYVVDVPSGHIVEMGAAGDSDGSASPAGQIVFVRDVGDFNYELFVMSGDGKDRRQVTALNSYLEAPHFSPDGKTVVVLSDPRRRRRPQLLSINVATGRATRLNIGEIR